MKPCPSIVLTVLIVILLSIPAFPISLRRGVYKFPAEIDPLVLDQVETELWAEIVRPSAKRSQPFPLVIFLHGNHGTCGRLLPSGIRRDDNSQYTSLGECPQEQYKVVPNHEGYRYVTRAVAQKGVITLSINANRGITTGSGNSSDFGLVLARGNLVLKHLALLARWNSGEEETPARLGPSLKGQINFANVGLVGHSRGGEGVRAALELYKEENSVWKPRISEQIRFQAIFEIAPVDGMSRRVLDVEGVSSLIVIPSCDGDVFDLQGLKVFDRVFKAGAADRLQRPKGTLIIHGANHNGFNTEWQESDSFGCDGVVPLFPLAGQSRPMREILVRTLVPFFEAWLLGVPTKATIFDPAYPVPKELTDITFFERGHLRAPPTDSTGVRVIQRFSRASGVSDDGRKNDEKGVIVRHQTQRLEEHSRSTRTAQVSWRREGEHYYGIKLNGSRGQNFSEVRGLSLRIGVGCYSFVCTEPIEDVNEVDVRVTLVDIWSRRTNQVPLADYITLRRPTGSSLDIPHEILQTAELPMWAFTATSGFSFNVVRQIHLDFFDIEGRKPGGIVFLGEITTDDLGVKQLSFSSRTARSGQALEPTSQRIVSGESPINQTVDVSHNMAIRAVRDNGIVILSLISRVPFSYTNSFPMLFASGRLQSRTGVVTNMGVEVKFMLAPSEFYDISPGSEVSVRIGSRRWEFGPYPGSLEVL